MSKSFEDIEVWQLSRIFVKEIYELTNNNYFNKDWDLRNQIRKASVSILSNISEGFERKTTKEFINFLNYAKGSSGEVRSQLYIALDLNYLTETDFKKFYKEILLISKSLSGLIKYLSKKEP
jgi:four helix bundle protein